MAESNGLLNRRSSNATGGSNPPLSATLCPTQGSHHHRRLFGGPSVENRQRTQRQLRKVLCCPLRANCCVTHCKQGYYILFKPNGNHFPDTWRTGNGKRQFTPRKNSQLFLPILFSLRKMPIIRLEGCFTYPFDRCSTFAGKRRFPKNEEAFHPD